MGKEVLSSELEADKKGETKLPSGASSTMKMKLPAAAYSAEVATSATKAGSYREHHRHKTQESARALDFRS